MEHAEELEQIVRETPWLMNALHLVRYKGPPMAYVAAGSIRDLAWDRLTGRSASRANADVDIVYFDDCESNDRSREHEDSLRAADPMIPWEVINQAFVHQWHRLSGLNVAAFPSLEAGLRSWPETATAVAVRLDSQGLIQIVAPFGLTDLFSLTLRRNQESPNAAAFSSRVSDKRWLDRWPELRFSPMLSTAMPAFQEANAQPGT